jgi:hypothetical protein
VIRYPQSRTFSSIETQEPKEVRTTVAKISRNRLEQALNHLRVVSENASALANRDIDWRVIRTELGRLESAMDTGNGTNFDEAFKRLRVRLSLPRIVRGKIGPAPKDEVPRMPPPVFELLNHMVHKLRLDLDKVSDQKQRDETDKSE